MSGITAHIRGWDVGARVHCYAAEDGSDQCAIWVTTGSNGRAEWLLATVTQDGCVTTYPQPMEQAS